ncbi:hypothetical protein NMG60_11030751 [Bertholletia excelsa]
MPWIYPQRTGVLTPPPLSPPLSASSLSYSPPLPPPPSSSESRISPIVLFIIIIFAVIFLICGILHLLVKFLLKQRSSPSSSISQPNYPEMDASDAFQRQLQQLFHLHDSGLDQAFIDALPVFLYEEIMGLKEPFDCAVCLCEFSESDKLRLLPLCGHAFHIDCIDTWLFSNSTCPLCRNTLFANEISLENPDFSYDDPIEEDGYSSQALNAAEKVFPVRLGKFRSTNGGEGGERGDREEGETSSSNLDARRCYSMGSLQYVVASSSLQVVLCPGKASGNGGNLRGRDVQNGNSMGDGDTQGKRISSGSKGESFSVSKIWLWSKKGKFPSPYNIHMPSSVNVGL